MLIGSDSGVKKAVGRVIQGWMSFSRLLRDSVEILGSGSERSERKKSKGKGREALNEDAKGKTKVLREGRTVPSDKIDPEPYQEVEEKVCGVVLGTEASRCKMNLYGRHSSLRIRIEKESVR